MRSIKLQKSLGAACALFLALGIIAPGAAQDAVPAFERTAPWNTENSDLKADDSVVYGRLPNGLRYALKRNERPENQVIVRLGLDFGAAAEGDSEQGLAHYIEHMAFNGTTYVPEGQMVPMLEKLGLSFGADTNASTGFTRTTYKLDLPNASPELLAQALFLMREAASEIVFDPDAVDRERGVVLAEMRQRDNYAQQALMARHGFFYPGSFLADRFPIGKSEVLEKATAEQMKQLYSKWYRPERAQLVIVGPINIPATERMLAERFGNWARGSQTLPDLGRCQIDVKDAALSGQFAHPSATELAMVMQLLPDGKRYDTRANMMLALNMEIAGAIIADRLSRRLRSEDLPLRGASMIFEPGLCDNYARLGFSASSKDGRMAETLPIIEQAVRQAVEHGFTAQEIDEQKRRITTRYANAARGADTRPSASLAEALVNLDDGVLNHPAELTAVWLEESDRITASSVGAEFARWYARLDRPRMFFESKTAVDEKSLLAAFANSRKVAVLPPAERDNGGFAYTDFGPAGEIAREGRIDDLDIKTVRFANNVLLNLKKTDFEKGRVRFTLRIAGGELAFGKADAPLTSLFNSAYISAGLEAHDYSDLRSLFAGSTVDFTLAANDEYFSATGSVAPEEIEKQMQLLAAYIYHPGWREEALRLFRKPLDESYARLDATPAAALNVAYNQILTDNDPRFSLTPLETVKAMDFEQLRTALGETLTNNRLEIGLVGDFDEAEAIAAVQRSFGALPARSADAPDDAAARQTSWSGKTGVHIVPHRGEPEQLAWRRAWTIGDGRELKDRLTMDLVARVADVLLLDELRERLGASYGGSANSYMSDIYPGRGLFSISTQGKVSDIALIEQAVDEVVAQLTAGEIDAAIFERARAPVIEAYRDWRTQNATWAGVVAFAQTEPQDLEDFRRNEAVFRSITRADVLAAAQRYLKSKESYIFRSVPAAFAEAAKAAETAAAVNPPAAASDASLLELVTGDDAKDEGKEKPDLDLVVDAVAPAEKFVPVGE